jgi:hypothetical protein
MFNLHFNFRHFLPGLAIVFLFANFSLFFTTPVNAATGINRTINFQGKLVNNSAGTNVANTTYKMVFSLYNLPSGGTPLWSETYQNTTAVPTVDGIFRVALGSQTAFPANFNFNWDGLYLGVTVGTDSEMTPRVQMASVPFAFNAQQVAGLTVQDDAGNASTSGTLGIGNTKTVIFKGSHSLTFNDASATTDLTLRGSGSLYLVDETSTQTLTGKTIGSGGLTFTGASTDITTGTNEDFIIAPNGTGRVGIFSPSGAAPLASLDIRGNSGTLAIASMSAKTSYAGLVVDNQGLGDLFTASYSGATRFVINNLGYVGVGTATPGAALDVLGAATIGGQLTFKSTFGQIQTTALQQLTIGGGTTGKIVFSAYNGPALSVGSTGGLVFAGYTGAGAGCTLKTDSNGNLKCDTDNTTAGVSSPFVQIGGANGGIIYSSNNTTDFLFGGQSTASATFHLFGNAAGGTNPVASVSANTSFAAFVVDNSGVGDLFTASVSGQTKFTVTNSGGINASGGLTINRIGTTDIVKSTSGNNTQDSDFQRTANSTTASLINISNSNDSMSLQTGAVTGNGTITTTGQPTTAGAIGAGASSITRPDGKYLVIRGGGTALDIFDSLANAFYTTVQVLTGNAGAGSVAIQRANGKYLVVHGGGTTTTTVIDPMQNAATVAGPGTTTANGAGTNIFRRQNGQVLLIHGGAAGTTHIYNTVANSFVTGPTAASTTWGAGSLVLPRPDGSALIITGGASANTRLYDAYNGAASIGSFTAGPPLPTGCEINGAGSVAMQTGDGRYTILSKANVSVVYDPATNTMGPCQSVGPPAALADGAHAIRLQDRRFFILRGSGTTNAYIYDPQSNTYSSGGTLGTMGAGLHSIQTADGTWQILLGGGTATNSYDSQLIMNGSYTSEDINSSELNPTSTLLWTMGAESLFSGTSSATIDTPQSGVEFSVRTAPTQAGLATAIDRPVKKIGDNIGAAAGDSWIRVTINFTRPLPPLLLYDTKVWTGKWHHNLYPGLFNTDDI